MAEDQPAEEEIAAAVVDGDPANEEVAPAPPVPTAEEEESAAAAEPASVAEEEQQEPAAVAVDADAAQEAMPAAAEKTNAAPADELPMAIDGAWISPVSFSNADVQRLEAMALLGDNELPNANPLVKISKGREKAKEGCKAALRTFKAKYCSSSYHKVQLSEEEEAKGRLNPNIPPVNKFVLGFRACCKCGSHGSPKEFISYNLFDVVNMTVAILMFLCYGLRVVITYGYDKTPGSWSSDPWTRTDAGASGYARGYMSGPYGSGEFIVTLLLAIVATGIFVAKLIRHMFCPDRIELTRRADYDQLESYRSAGGSSA